MRFQSKIKWILFKKSFFFLSKWAHVIYKVSVKLIWTAIGRIQDLGVALPYGKYKASGQNWHASLKWYIFDKFCICSIKKSDHNCWQKVFLKTSKTSQLTRLAHLIVTNYRWSFHDLMKTKGFNAKRKKLRPQHKNYDFARIIEENRNSKNHNMFQLWN